jgi:hypothetical protein
MLAFRVTLDVTAKPSEFQLPPSKNTFLALSLILLVNPPGLSRRKQGFETPMGAPILSSTYLAQPRQFQLFRPATGHDLLRAQAGTQKIRVKRPLTALSSTSLANWPA